MEPGALRSGDIRKGVPLHEGSLPGTSALYDLPSFASPHGRPPCVTSAHVLTSSGSAGSSSAPARQSISYRSMRKRQFWGKKIFFLVGPAQARSPPARGPLSTAAGVLDFGAMPFGSTAEPFWLGAVRLCFAPERFSAGAMRLPYAAVELGFAADEIDSPP